MPVLRSGLIGGVDEEVGIDEESPMVLTLCAGEHFLDVVETSHEAWPEGESFGAKLGLTPFRLAEHLQPGPERLVHDFLERDASLASFLFEFDRHVIVDRQCGPHALMLRH